MEDYLQKIGRAGRMEFKENGGESYIFPATLEEFKHAEQLVKREVPFLSVTTATSKAGTEYFQDGGPFHQLLLVSVVSHLSQKKVLVSFQELVDIARSTFWFEMCSHDAAASGSAEDLLTEHVKEALLEMKDRKLIHIALSSRHGAPTVTGTVTAAEKETAADPASRVQENWVRVVGKLEDRPEYWRIKATLLGKATAKSGLPIQAATQLWEWLEKGISIFSFIGRFALVVPVFTTVDLRFPSPSPWDEKWNNTWSHIQSGYKKLGEEDQLAMQNLGYDENTVDAINNNFQHRNNGTILKRYRRIQSVLILIDIWRQVGTTEMCRRWHNLNQSKLDDFRLEAVKMCVKVRRFCQALNLSEAAGLFDKSLQKLLMSKKGAKQQTSSYPEMGMEHVYRKALKSAGLVTPEQIARVSVQAIAAALEQNLPDTIVGDLSRANEIRQKICRHLQRLSVHIEQDSESESDAYDSDIDSDIDID